MFLRRMARPLMARVKETTGIVGLDVVPNAREVLIGLYSKTLKEIQAVPEDEGYRKAVESFTRHRLQVCKEEEDWEAIERRLGCGQVEELIEEAEDELKLIAKMIVSYVKRLNIPSGVVGACRLDLAYEHFKEKPHLFQFIPNEKQVKEANKLLKTMPLGSDRKKVDGVPVFSAQNLDIAIATTDGIKWYTPYFFDKNMLDNILEESVDQHFHGLIQTRNLQRRRDIIDDNLSEDVSEQTAESMWEPPEVQEVLDEVGHPAIPLSVLSKAAEIQLLHAVDRILLGNRWLRKATGIQPKFPYVVDSFEKRSTTSLLRAAESSNFLSSSDSENTQHLQHSTPPEPTAKESVQLEKGPRPSFQFPFGDWSKHPFSRRQQHHHDLLEKRVEVLSPLLPKITMVGVSSGESGQPSKASLKKTMEDLTRELEQTDSAGEKRTETQFEDRDPLFVANVGDYYGTAKTGSGRWVRAGIN